MMLGMSLTLLAMMQTTVVQTIDIVDADANPKLAYVIINDVCKVPVLKTELKKDYDTVIEKVIHRCNL